MDRPFGECRNRSAGVLPTLVRELQDVGHGRVREGERRCTRHGAGHVGDAVEQRIVHGEGRVVVGRGPGVFEAAALVDRDVDQYRTRLHLGHDLVRDQFGRLGPGTSTAPMTRSACLTAASSSSCDE